MGKDTERNAQEALAAARGSSATIAEAILGKWTLCQALGDNGEYYPCPGDEDEQLAELTIVIEDALKPKPKTQNTELCDAAAPQTPDNNPSATRQRSQQ